MADYLDAIYRGMTTKQAAAIVQLLEGDTQQEVASKLGKSKSTISQLVTAGRWPEIEKILQQFENLIKQLT
jgi:transcriptional regulator with XRE-family HTH domain